MEKTIELAHGTEGCPRDGMERRMTQLGFSNATVAGEGLYSVVFKATSRAGAAVAVKFPRTRFVNSPNDGRVDCRDQFLLEVLMACRARQSGVPTAELLDVVDDGALTCSIWRYVAHDHSKPGANETAKTLKGLHDISLDDELIATVPSAVEEILKRIPARQARLQDFLRADLTPLADNALQATRELSGPLCLLHLDFRPANVLTLRGEIVALIDWDNVLVGHPWVELARIAEYDNYSWGIEDIRQRYPVPSVPGPIDAVLRYDAALMLSVVFAQIAPDPGLLRHYLQRLELLAVQSFG